MNTRLFTIIRQIILHRLFPVFLIVLLALALRLYRIDEPTNLYFDEVYHGFTGIEYAQGNADAYDPWAAPPAGFAFEWTHPPVAKLAMAGSILVFGENSFAWRFPPAIFGSISIFLAALLAYKLFRSERIALLTALFLSVEGLHFVMSRIAMNDTTFICFFLAGLLLYLEAKNRDQSWKFYAGAGLFLGLALASKWTTLYGFALIGLDQLVFWWNRRKWPDVPEFIMLVLTLGVLPILVYFASYTQYFSLGFTMKEFIELQKQMWWYHTGLKATHGYQSRPWQWLLDLRPVWMYSNSSGLLAQNIYAMGNPVILWSGLIATLVFAWETVKKGTKNGFFLLAAYFSMWLPWVFSPRIMFFYHYLPAIMFLSIILAWVLEKKVWPAEKNGRTAVIAFIGLATLWFVAFYPNLTGVPVPMTFAENVYFVIKSWR